MSFNPFSGGGPDLMFSLMPVFFGAIFFTVLLVIIFVIFKGVKQWNYNNRQPVLSVFAKVVTKRVDVSHSMHHNANDAGGMHHHSDTTYFATFEVESGDRMEFALNGREYGLLAEGDMGKLTFQGTRYLGFERKPG